MLRLRRSECRDSNLSGTSKILGGTPLAPYHKKLLLFLTFLVAVTVFSGCTQSLVSPVSGPTGSDLLTDDPQDVQLSPEGTKTPPDVYGKFSFIGTGTNSAGEAFTLNLGGGTATRLAKGTINLNCNKDQSSYVVTASDGTTEVYTFASGGGQINLAKGTLNYNVNFTDPNGQPGILKFKGSITVNIEDSLPDGNYQITNLQAIYIEGDAKDVLNYQNAAITLTSEARVGTFSFTATGTTTDNGQTVAVNINLSGIAKGFLNAPVMRWNARAGNWTMGDEVYLINTDKNNPGAVKTDTGEIRYNGNFLLQGNGEPGIGKFKGTVSGITLNNGKVQGTFPVTLKRAVYNENNGTECVVTITSASITFDIH